MNDLLVYISDTQERLDNEKRYNDFLILSKELMEMQEMSELSESLPF